MELADSHGTMVIPSYMEGVMTINSLGTSLSYTILYEKTLFRMSSMVLMNVPARCVSSFSLRADAGVSELMPAR